MRGKGMTRSVGEGNCERSRGGGDFRDFLKANLSFLWNPIKHLSTSCQLIMRGTDHIYFPLLALGLRWGWGGGGCALCTDALLYAWGYTMYSTKPGLPWKQTTKHSFISLSLSFSLAFFSLAILCKNTTSTTCTSHSLSMLLSLLLSCLL